MCSNCNTIDETIARYKRLRFQISDQRVQQATARLMAELEAKKAALHRAVYEHLKSGGSYVIIDHAAAVGSGTSDAQSLHRIEPASLRAEVEAAGFVQDAESSVLANKDDPHSVKVLDPSIKGETDRFAYRFVKP